MGDGESAAAAPPPSAAQPSVALPAAPPPPSPAPLQVVSVAPSPAANRDAASATPDALALAEGGLPSRSASLAAATPLGQHALQPHDPDTDDEEDDIKKFNEKYRR